MNINFVKDIFKNDEDLDPNVYKDFLAKQLILRDYLSIERTILTNESTFLAYVRTGLTIIVVGITGFKLSTGNALFEWIGIILALSGVLTLIIGISKTVQMRHKIHKFLKKREEIEKID